MRKKDRINFKTVLILMVGIILMTLVLFFYTKKLDEDSFELFLNDNNQLEITFSSNDDCYVLESDKSRPNINSTDWQEAINNDITFELKDTLKYYYVKCGGTVYYVGTNKNIGTAKVDVKEQDKYLIKDNSYDVEYDIDTNGYIEEEPLITSSDEKVISVKGNKIKAVGNGEATITVSILDQSDSIYFVVTDLIQNMPDEFDVDKELLPCERYTKEDNDLIDELLKHRINEAGYKTRGAAVAATRFLLLEFPYRLDYFYEYGRQAQKIDGEGRYYLEGLYLDESRFERLIGSQSKPQTWGCPLYSGSIKKKTPNGLDCSGFVSWVLNNAGFDCGDIGSGYAPEFDLSDISKRITNNKKNTDKAKVGDLVHSTYMGGHIGIIAGKKDDYFYVAQATPKNDWGVTITKYDQKEFIKNWDAIILMDDYYKEEGNYTDYWN